MTAAEVRWREEVARAERQGHEVIVDRANLTATVRVWNEDTVTRYHLLVPAGWVCSRCGARVQAGMMDRHARTGHDQEPVAVPGRNRRLHPLLHVGTDGRATLRAAPLTPALAASLADALRSLPALSGRSPR